MSVKIDVMTSTRKTFVQNVPNQKATVPIGSGDFTSGSAMVNPTSTTSERHGRDPDKITAFGTVRRALTASS